MGDKMETAGKVTEKILDVAIVLALLLVFSARAQAGITVTPTSLSFAARSVGTTSAPAQITITNNNKNGLKIVAGSVSISQYSLTGHSFPVTLSHGQSATWYVTFTPNAAQSYSSAASFTRKWFHDFRGLERYRAPRPETQSPIQFTALNQEPHAIEFRPASTAGQTATFSRSSYRHDRP